MPMRLISSINILISWATARRPRILSLTKCWRAYGATANSRLDLGSLRIARPDARQWQLERLCFAGALPGRYHIAELRHELLGAWQSVFHVQWLWRFVGNLHQWPQSL